VRRIFQVVLVVLLFGAAGLAHREIAPDGYYPYGYNGDAWVGAVVKADDATRAITLEDTYKGKKETFVGVLEEGYLAQHKSGAAAELKPSDIPIGLRLTVLYFPTTKKVNGRKVHVNVIFNIDRIPNQKKPKTPLPFKTFYRGD
jgi:hypothetical protein